MGNCPSCFDRKPANNYSLNTGTYTDCSSNLSNNYFSTIAQESSVPAAQNISTNRSDRPSDRIDSDFYSLKHSEELISSIEALDRELVRMKGWVVYLKSQNIAIQLRKGSQLNEYIPVSKTTWMTTHKLDTNCLINMIINPSQRLKWDYSLLTYETLIEKPPSYSVQRTVCKIKSAVREMVEERVVKRTNNMCTVISRSVSSKKNKHTIADVLFTIIKLVEIDEKIVVEITSQIDYKLPKKTSKNRIYGLVAEKWIRRLKKAIIQ